jgi:hypothetical protein
VSSLFEPSHDDLLARLIADVTDEEIEFMLQFGIIDDNGKVDKSEFLVLMAVRIGKASIQLLGTIHERFRELDRKNTKKISLDDIVEGRQKITPAMRKAMFANVGLNSVTMSSFADVETELATLARRVKLRASMVSSLSGVSSMDTIEDREEEEEEEEEEAGDGAALPSPAANALSAPCSPSTELEKQAEMNNLEIACEVGPIESAVTTENPEYEGEHNKVVEPIVNGDGRENDSWSMVNDTKFICDPPVTGDWSIDANREERKGAEDIEEGLRSAASAAPLLSKRGRIALSVEVDDVASERDTTCSEPDDTLSNLVQPSQKLDSAESKSLQSVIENLRGSVIARHSSMRSPSQFWQTGGEDEEELGAMPLPLSLTSLRHSRFSNMSYFSDVDGITPQPPGKGSFRATPRLGRQGSMQSVSSLPPMSPGLQRMMSVQSLGISNSYPVYVWSYHIGDLESERAIWIYKSLLHPYCRLLTVW